MTGIEVMVTLILLNRLRESSARPNGSMFRWSAIGQRAASPD